MTNSDHGSRKWPRDPLPLPSPPPLFAYVSVTNVLRSRQNARDLLTLIRKSVLTINHATFIPSPKGDLITTIAISQFFENVQIEKCTLAFYCTLLYQEFYSLRSWTYSTKFLDMTTSQTKADMSSYIKNGEWEVIDVPVTENKLYYVCCPDPYADITFTIHMKRKVLYYIFNLIVPTTIIVTFILVGFCLPPITGERITLNITVLLTMTVFLNIASNTLPSTSDAIPLLGDYYLILMILVCFAILSTCIVLRYYYAGPTRMPERLRIIINEWIASFLFFVITRKPKGKGINQWCGKRTEQACYDCDETNNLMAAQSYIVQNENNTAEERIALIEIHPKNPVPRVNGIQGQHQRVPLGAASSPMKSKSEPAINLTSGPSGASEKRIRRRKVSIVPKRSNALNTVQNRVMDGLGVLTRRVKEDNERGEIIEEWEFAAIVLDRLFFVLYSLTFVIPLLVFFWTAPTPKTSLVEPQ